MNYIYQLDNISTRYRKFSKGQYVKHTQFNEFLDYFEDQDRLSRVMLEGVGVVCGFQPQPIYKNKQLTGLLLSQGVAITTDGDLLTLNIKSKTQDLSGDSYISERKDIGIDFKEYTHYKVYDNHKAKYPGFFDSTGVYQSDLWELATADEATTGFLPLSTLTDLDDKYLLLYLESYEKEVKPCRGVDCDNHGEQQIRNLKVLFATGSGMERLIDADTVYPERNLLAGSINELKMKRVVITPGMGTPAQLKQAYKNVVSSSNYTRMFADIDFICQVLNMPVINRSGFISRLNQLANENKNFQYAYAVLRDLNYTYTEIAKALPTSFTKCFPNLRAFPKHIMLGRLNFPNVKILDRTRHHFYNATILDDKKITKRLRTLVERFNQQTIEFRDPTNIGNAGIGITPTKRKKPLSESAIPFYYNISDKFLRLWNFDKTNNRRSNTNLTYDKTLLASNLHIRQPLDYNIDNEGFYNIEGHQGGDYREVMEMLKTFKDTKQLGFEVMAVSLTQLVDNKDFYKADFADYVEKNPGMEHIGGVKRGGTLVLVYNSEADPAVIADFSLPYICCTPRTSIGLTLPSATTCRDAKPMIFNVTPSNGEVKAVVNGGINGGVVKINGQYMFDPAVVHTSLLGNEIKFTVNGKPTDCKVKVLSNPNVTVAATFFEYPEGDSDRTIVTFNVSGTNVADYQYQWDFLGTGAYVPLQPDANGNVKYTFFKINPIAPVNVLISASGCSQRKTLTNWYVPEPVDNHTPPTVVSLTAYPPHLYWPDYNQSKIYRVITPGDGTITNYVWSSTGGSGNVEFYGDSSDPVGTTFPGPGTYTVKLTVKDSNGKEGSNTLVMVVDERAALRDLIVSPAQPTTNDGVTVEAVISNPSNIQDLQYNWYVDGDFVNTTTSNVIHFGAGELGTGNRRIEVFLTGSFSGSYDPSSIAKEVFISEAPMRGGTSFLENTIISMADGTKKKIQEVVKGDRLKSTSGVVSVINTVNYVDDVRLYRLNDQNYFITGPHPVRTNEGWKSFDPEKTRQFVTSVQVGQLNLEDLLLKEDGKYYHLTSNAFISGQYKVYNLEVTGETRDYFANGYSVYSEIEPLPQP